MEAESRTPIVRDPRNDDRIHSWKEIANYLNRTVRTVQRWERSEHLPVHRRDAAGVGPVYAYKSELDAWLLEVFPPNETRVDQLEPVAVKPAVEVPRSARRTRVFVIAAIAAGALILAFTTWKLWPRENTGIGLQVVRLTDLPGNKRNPAFSPDGKQLAFSWNGKNLDNFDIYTRSLYSGTPVRLTQDPASDLSPAWSSDSRFIAFFRRSRASAGVTAMVVPAGGGLERKIADCSRTDTEGFPMTMAWTPDGKWLIVPSAPTAGAAPSLVLVSPETLETRPLTGAPPGSLPDCCPALSADGRTLAFLRAAGSGGRQIFLLSLDRDTRPVGEPKQLTVVPSEAIRPTWIDDGRALLYLTSHEGVWALWRVSPSSSQKPTQVALLPPIGEDWSVSSKGDLVAFTDSVSRAEIWRMDLRDGGKLNRFISSSRSNSVDPQYSPDGSKLAYESILLGETSIIVADREGNKAITVTTGTPQRMSPIRWSPDGTRLTYECVEGGNPDICTVSATGGEVRRETKNPARDSLPSWSRDGKSIYFTSDRSGTSQIWKLPVNGSEDQAVQLTRDGGFGAVDSPDGATIYYVRQQGVGGLFRMPASGGKETALDGSLGLTGVTSNLATTSRGIYYPASPSPEQWVDIWRYPFKSQKPERLARLDTMLATGMSVSPDDRYLLFSAHEKVSGDIYMVKSLK